MFTAQILSNCILWAGAGRDTAARLAFPQLDSSSQAYPVRQATDASTAPGAGKASARDQKHAGDTEDAQCAGAQEERNQLTLRRGAGIIMARATQRGRDTCAGCRQTRGEDTPMITCSGCRVARFCSADHQKMASKKAALGGSLWTGRSFLRRFTAEQIRREGKERTTTTQLVVVSAASAGERNKLSQEHRGREKHASFWFSCISSRTKRTCTPFL